MLSLLGGLSASIEAAVVVVAEVAIGAATSATSAPTAASLAAHLPVVALGPLVLPGLLLWLSQSLLEVFILKLHALLHFDKRLNLSLQSLHDLGVAGRAMPKRDRIRAVLRAQHQSEHLVFGYAELLSNHGKEKVFKELGGVRLGRANSPSASVRALRILPKRLHSLDELQENRRR